MTKINNPSIDQLNIVIVAFGDVSYIMQALKSIEKYGQNTQVIIFNNDINHDLTNLVKKYNLHITLISSKKNRGFARANNICVRLIKSQWILFLNPDAKLTEDTIKQFYKALQIYPNIKSFATKLYCDDDKKLLDGFGDAIALGGIYFRRYHKKLDKSLSINQKVFSACGAGHFIFRKTFLQLHGFERKLFCYGEDIDLGYKLCHANINTIALTNCKIIHQGSSISGRNSDFTVFYGARNRVIVFFKNTPIILMLIHIPFFLLFFLYFIWLNKRRKTLLVFLKGNLDGLKNISFAWKKRKSFSFNYTLKLIQFTQWNVIGIYKRISKNILIK